MTITAAHIQPIVALIAGVIILIMPRFLNLVVAIYLIFIGLVGSWLVQDVSHLAVERASRLAPGTAQTWCKARIPPPLAECV